MVRDKHTIYIVDIPILQVFLSTHIIGFLGFMLFLEIHFPTSVWYLPGELHCHENIIAGHQSLFLISKTFSNPLDDAIAAADGSDLEYLSDTCLEV